MDDVNVVLKFPFCPAGDLGAFFSHRSDNPETLRRMLVDICAGVEHLHRAGLAHRDLKPENIFLDGNTTAVIGDYGLCRFFPPQRDDDDPPTNMVTTLMYRDIALMMCSEFVVSFYDPFAADVWSLACILAELLHPRHRRVFAYRKYSRHNTSGLSSTTPPFTERLAHINTRQVQEQIFGVIGRPSQASVCAIFGPWAGEYDEDHWPETRRMKPVEFLCRELECGIFGADVMEAMSTVLMDIFVLDPAERPRAAAVGDRVRRALEVVSPPPPPAVVVGNNSSAKPGRYHTVYRQLCDVWRKLTTAHWQSGKWLDTTTRAPPPYPSSTSRIACRTEALLAAWRSMLQVEGHPLMEAAVAAAGPPPWFSGVEETAAFTVAMQCDAYCFPVMWAEDAGREVEAFRSTVREYLTDSSKSAASSRERRHVEQALTILMLNVLHEKQPWAAGFAEAFFTRSHAAVDVEEEDEEAALHAMCHRLVAIQQRGDPAMCA